MAWFREARSSISTMSFLSLRPMRHTASPLSGKRRFCPSISVSKYATGKTSLNSTSLQHDKTEQITAALRLDRGDDSEAGTRIPSSLALILTFATAGFPAVALREAVLLRKPFRLALFAPQVC